MAEDINAWLDKLKDVDRDTVVAWISEASAQGYTKEEMQEYIMDKYKLSKAPADIKDSLVENFKRKWLKDPKSSEQITPSVPEKEEPREEAAITTGSGNEVPSQEEPDDKVTPVKKGNITFLDGYGGHPVEPDTIDEEKDFENVEETDVPEDMEPPPFKDPIPFDNPDLNDMAAEEELDAPAQDEILAQIKNKMASVNLAKQTRQDFITKTIDMEEYSEAMEPYRPYLDLLKKDPSLLEKFAQMTDKNNPPPYMQLRHILINNEIKDPNTLTILMSTIDEAMPDRTVQKWLPLPQARSVTRSLAEQGYYQSALNNYDAIVEEMEKHRANLVSLIYMLEIYCEAKQVSPFDFHIPKEQLTNTVAAAFSGIHETIRTMVVDQLRTMSTEIRGEMIDVSEVVENNMSRLDSQMADAIERVLWKVKTDVDQTNLEDIKRSILWVVNKRQSAINLGVGPVAITSCMLDDLEKRLVNENFKLDKITQFRVYTIKELQKRMNYKIPHVIKKGIITLRKAGIIRIDEDFKFSLAK